MQKPIIKTVMLATLVAIFMFSFTFALSPLYNKYCKVLGINTATRINDEPDLSRTITVQFIAMNNQNLAWDFYPVSKEIRIHPNENKKIIFVAKNKTSNTMSVQAIPSYTPIISVQHFHKTQCFCFNRQTLKPGQTMNMPVVFHIDKDLPKEIGTITVAYTLFDVTRTS